jgi:hypothetical protein
MKGKNTMKAVSDELSTRQQFRYWLEILSHLGSKEINRQQVKTGSKTLYPLFISVFNSLWRSLSEGFLLAKIRVN